MYWENDNRKVQQDWARGFWGSKQTNEIEQEIEGGEK
jgi:hypothetical protein